MLLEELWSQMLLLLLMEDYEGNSTSGFVVFFCSAACFLPTGLLRPGQTLRSERLKSALAGLANGPWLS